MSLYEMLEKRESENNRIGVGLVGCGHMGSGFIHVTEKMPGMRVRAVADLDMNRAISTFESIGLPRSMVEVVENRNDAEDALRRDKRIATQDALLLSKTESLEAVVEATGSIETGAAVAWNCIQYKKHVIMLNVETDVTVGLFLHRMAQKTGCVYTVASGDEPGVCKSLYNFSKSLGFEVVCLGKGKNNPVDYYATEESCREEATRKGMNPKMLAAFKDGTKTMVEMAAVSNGTGLIPDVPGMHGLKVDREDLVRKFIPKSDGGLFANRGVVDYSTGKVAPGVFAVITTDDARIRDDMRFLSMGDGPYYMLFRPYHLCNIETPISVASAVFRKETTLVPSRMVSEIVAVAKRDLRSGERVGDLGGPDIYNTIYREEEAKSLGCIPMGLAVGGTVRKDIKRDDLLSEDNFIPDTSTVTYKIRKIQETLSN